MHARFNADAGYLRWPACYAYIKVSSVYTFYQLSSCIYLTKIFFSFIPLLLLFLSAEVDQGSQPRFQYMASAYSTLCTLYTLALHPSTTHQRYSGGGRHVPQANGRPSARRSAAQHTLTRPTSELPVHAQARTLSCPVLSTTTTTSQLPFLSFPLLQFHFLLHRHFSSIRSFFPHSTSKLRLTSLSACPSSRTGFLQRGRVSITPHSPFPQLSSTRRRLTHA